jgi:hypothetical protein
MSGWFKISRRRSAARIARARIGSSTSMLAERVSPPNIASSPKIAPGRSSVRVMTRPSEWRRVTRAAPDLTTKHVSPVSPSRKTTCPAS